MLPRWLVTFRAFAIACAFAAAFVPIATYITDDKRDWLWIHIGVNIAAYIAVALTTISTTVSLMQQDHNKFSVPAYWTNNVVMRTWYLGVSKTWRWHVAAAVGRLGLALALAQHVHIVGLYVDWIDGGSRPPDFQGILNQFLYYSYNNMPKYTTEVMSARSQWETAFIGFIVLCGFAILETSLLACWTLLVHYIRKRIFIGPFLLRLGLVIIFIGVMNQSQQIIRYEYHRQFLQGTFRTAFTWLDNGTMLSVWIMRPMTHAGWNYACVEQEGDPLYYDCLRYDNRPHILNDAVIALISYATYILAIIASLQLAQYLHWRREQSLTTSPVSTN